MTSNLTEVDASISTLLSESIEAVLGDLLGNRGKQAVYLCLERQGLERDKIPEHLSSFEVFLEDKFGRAGGVIERQIAKRFYRMLGLDLVEVPYVGLTDYVNIAFRRALSDHSGHVRNTFPVAG